MGWNDHYEGLICEHGYPISFCPELCVEDDYEETLYGWVKRNR